MTGQCDCGATVERETATGPLADRLNALPFVCDACIERSEREDAERERVEAARRAHERALSRQMASGLPGMLRPVRLDQLDRDSHAVDAIAAATRWAEGELAGLLLTGEMGVGKTTIAAGAANLMFRRRGLQWVSVAILFAQLARGFGDRDRIAATDAITATGALVLDDLDKARPSEFGAEVIFAAIDQRITAGAPLLVTTNLSLGQLADRWPDPYGPAIASRLAGYCTAIRITGPDRRLTRGVA